MLPFTNLSNDPEQRYFADGITEDLTTDLSRISDSFVISRNTAFTYRNKPVDTKQIGRDLCVRYVLEGSVRRSGNQVRVNAQLIDAATAAHLWAERFDGDIGDLFALQDEITGRIANALNLALIGAEAARPAEHPDALDCIFRGRAAFNRPTTRDSLAKAIGLSSAPWRMIRIPSRRRAGWRALVGRVSNHWSSTEFADIARAEGLTAEALAVSPSNPLAHYAKGFFLATHNRRAEAIPEFEAVVACDRNWAAAIAQLGRCRFSAGWIEEMIPAQEQAIRLSPRDPLIYGWCLWIGQAHLLQSRTEEAIVWLPKTRSANPAAPSVHAWLASAHALKGESERAPAELAEARRLSADDRFSSIARLQAGRYYGVPKVCALYETTYFAGLRKAGLPEE